MSNVGGGASASVVVSVLIEQNLKGGRGAWGHRFRTGKGLELVVSEELAPLPHSARHALPHSGARRSPPRRLGLAGRLCKPSRDWRECTILAPAPRESDP